MKLKIRIILLSIFLIIWSLISDSLFYKGGVDGTFQLIIFGVIFGICYVYISTVENFIVAERIIYSLLVVFLSLFVSLTITEIVLEKFYGFDYEKHQSEIIANLIFYFITNGFLVLSVLLIRKLKNGFSY